MFISWLEIKVKAGYKSWAGSFNNKVLKSRWLWKNYTHPSNWNGFVWLLGGSVWGVGGLPVANLPSGNQAFFTFLPCPPNRPPAGVTVQKYYRYIAGGGNEKWHRSTLFVQYSPQIEIEIEISQFEVVRTPEVINNISCKSEYITQPPTLAFGLGLDQWENM